MTLPPLLAVLRTLSQRMPNECEHDSLPLGPTGSFSE